LAVGDPWNRREKNWKNVLQEIAVAFPDKVVSILKYDNALSHKLYASGDIFLMPSLYEPCGLSQMIAMRYGNIPVARATGGLKNTIIDFHASPEGNRILVRRKNS